MTDKGRLKAILREHLPYLAAEYGVKRIGLFGSVAKEEAHETSDVDLLVEFERPIGFRFFDLVDELERLLGRPVDVLTPAGLKGIRVDWVAREIEETVEYVEAR